MDLLSLISANLAKEKRFSEQYSITVNHSTTATNNNTNYNKQQQNMNKKGKINSENLMHLHTASIKRTSSIMTETERQQ